MKPSNKSESLLSITRSKAKMYEYNVPEEIHIDIPRDPARLFTLTIGLLGNLAVGINSEEVTDDQLVELRQKLQFSAYFFDALQQSRLKEGLDPYLKLLGSASYYLCDLPGSASVLANSISDQPTNLDCLGLEDLLTNILKRSYSKIDVTNFLYEEPIRKISEGMIEYFNQEGNEDNIFEQTSILRKIAYENGTPRQLLFSDVISAIIKKQIENSSRRSLPQYSDLSPDQWSNILIKSSFVKELWPSQHMLGQQGIFRGKSAIVQMPTSAGKTKAIELIIRSAFIAKRATLAVIVAPYRALCNEIKNNLVKSFDDEPVSINQISDVLQVDFDIMEMLGTDQILVLTPEKLVYIIRHSPDLAEQIGLLIYDEGHQFDSGMRGITYELLVTSLKSTIPSEVQTILISAVMTNAESIGNWLNGSGSEIVSGSLLSPTYRTIAFTSWRDKRGRLEFVLPDNLDTLDFYVPRIIEQQELTLKKGERSPRIFPGRLEKKSISLYLGLKLVEKGSVAIFCGQKQTTSSLCEDVVEAFDRNLLLPKPIEFSNKEEVKRLHYLHECHLGLNAPVTQSSAIGIFAHHGNTPHGIRLAIEHAMKEGQIKFIICTSTLAQGVNLPIRYLIVATFYQGRQPIKIRDFQNLIGRAARSGTHSE